VEVVAGGVADVDEDRVVLRRPAPARAAAVVVGPDDLVEEAVAAEQAVEGDVQRAMRSEHPARLGEAGREEAEVVVEGVAVLQGAARLGPVAAAAEAATVAVRVRNDAQALVTPRPPRIEGRID